MSRPPISPKLRFEILKRDNWTCRYCGANAPEFKLVIDHLIPVKAGGTDDYFNLVVACFDCNAGKSARKLDDHSIERQQTQITQEFASEVSRQAEVAGRYQEAMRQQAINARALREMWLYKTGENLGHAWDPVLDKWLRVFGYGLLADCVQEVALRGRDILDVARFAAVTFADEKQPGMKQCYLMRGRIMKKFAFYRWDFENRALLLKFLADTTLEGSVRHNLVWTAIDRSDTLEQLVDELAGLSDQGPIVTPSFSAPFIRDQSVFVREGTPEWDAWQRYRYYTTGKGTPMDRNFGWHFPTRFPPDHPSNVDPTPPTTPNEINALP